METNTKIKFVVLLSMASFMGIQEGQAYKIYCPKGSELGMNAQNYFTGTTHSSRGPSINLTSTQPWQGGDYDPKNMRFWPGAFIINGELRCNYIYNGEGGYALIGTDPVLANCLTHVHPRVDYVTCH